MVKVDFLPLRSIIFFWPLDAALSHEFSLSLYDGMPCVVSRIGFVVIAIVGNTLGDEVGTEPIPDHQDHDTAASVMGAGGILRGQWRGAEKKKTRENSRKQSCEEHPIGHQSGREQSMSIAFGKGELLGMRERAKRSGFFASL